MTYNVQLVIDAKATLGEGPHWDEQSKTLYWVDILNKKLHAFQSETNTDVNDQFEQFIGAAVPSEAGKMILAMQNGLHQYEFATKQLTFLANPEADKPMNRFNDGKCDKYGRFYIGSMDVDAKEGAGALYRLDPDGQIHTLLTNLTISNGLAFSPDGKFLYHIDTPTGQVCIYNYDETTGDITYKQVGVKIPHDMGSPDGMTIDTEGMVWIAHWGGACVSRWNPQTGQQLDRIEIPAKNVTSCTFGGEHLDELYITTARIGLAEEELRQYPLSGGLFKVKLNVTGFPGNRYRPTK
ncbi:SMP-30/gluconolactonase/LRE family protein [Metabacillus malikii]|uniref:Sugar lactone lactonase YvrE n=1 Tax=Metabacillus malikii TaxID=1504265 RepID=A0ABT9ZIL3_9BACI|nr:SMP-30/gluconolactonase/LRE family protein [Metabacillus malikii]MDQ0232103.1 sugar lactone lactonase YvrE [Metabacillus malikii]